MHRLRGVVVVGVLAAVVVSVVAAAPAAAAKGGNSVAAKICQKGGWQTLVPVTGDADAFANQGDCVNDGAQGSPPLGSAGQGVCQGMGGSFRTQRPPNWTCEYTPNPPPNPPMDANTVALGKACGTDGGGLQASSNPTPSNPNNWLAICFI
jgi:hypothetical protein